MGQQCFEELAMKRAQKIVKFQLEGGGTGTYEHPFDLRPVCKLECVQCGSVETTKALYLSWFDRGGPKKFENNFFLIAKLRFR